MTTAAAVRSAWSTKVWADASVTAITPQIADYDLRAIRDGKAPDPGLLPGDIVDIGK